MLGCCFLVRLWGQAAAKYADSIRLCAVPCAESEEAPLSLLKSPLVSLWLLCSQAKGPRLLGRLFLVVFVLPSPAGHICWVMICQNAGKVMSSLCSAP